MQGILRSCELGQVLRDNVLQCIGQRHVTMWVVVAVGLSVRGDMHQFGPRALLHEGAEKPARKAFPVVEDSLQGNGA